MCPHQQSPSAPSEPWPEYEATPQIVSVFTGNAKFSPAACTGGLAVSETGAAQPWPRTVMSPHQPWLLPKMAVKEPDVLEQLLPDVYGGFLGLHPSVWMSRL